MTDRDDGDGEIGPDDQDSYILQNAGAATNSWKTTVLQSFGQKFEADKLLHRREGDYLIISPIETDREIEIELDLPSGFADWTVDQRLSYVGNLFQSYSIAGVNEIEVQLGEQWSEDLKNEINDLLFAASTIAGRYDPNTNKFQITNGCTFEEYTQEVAQFLDNYFFRTLQAGGGNVAIQEVNDFESRVDTNLALYTRNVGEVFFDLQRWNYPKELCGLYAGKYMEEVVDEAQKAIQIMHDKGQQIILVEPLLEKIFSILQGTPGVFENPGEFSVPTFVNQLEKVALSSYQLDVDVDEYTRQSNIYDQRISALEKLESDMWETMEHQIDEQDISLEQVLQEGVLFGKIISIVKRMVRIPFSITIVGLGTKEVHEVYGKG